MSDTTTPNEPEDPIGQDGETLTAELPPPPPPRRRLYRSERDKVIAGVAGGLGHYLDIDPVIVRLAFILLTIFGGAGLVLYLIAWLAVPAEATGTAATDSVASRISQAPTVVLVIALVVGGVLLATAVDIQGPAVVWALLLIGLGVLLFRHDTRAVHARAQQPAVAAAGPAAPAVSYDPWAAPPPEPKPRSPLGRFTLAVILLVIGVLAVLENVGAISVSGPQYVAVGLVGVGAGLIVGAWRGRAYWLIAVGLLLIPPLLISTALRQVSLSGGVGERFMFVDTVAEAEGPFVLGAGSLRVDVSDVNFGSQPVEMSAGVGFGELIVVVPSDVRVAVTGQMRAGEIAVLGELETVHFDDGSSDVSVGPVGDEGDPLLTIDLDMGFGEVAVTNDPAFRLAPGTPGPPFLKGPQFDGNRLFDPQEL